MVIAAWSAGSRRGRNHRLAAGLDPFGNCDLAFARQQLHRAHFPQIHADGIVRAVDIVIIQRYQSSRVGCRRSSSPRRRLRYRRRSSFSMTLTPISREKRHHVFDLFGRGPVLRHHRVQLIIGDIATLFGLRDQLLDRGLAHIEHRAVGVFALILAGSLRLSFAAIVICSVAS